MQLVGSLGLPENLREILTQLDEADLLVFFDAFKIPVPVRPTKAESDSIDKMTILIEVLIKECTQSQKEAKVSELTLFPTEQDLWTWDPFSGESRLQIQASFNNLKEMQLFEIDRLLKEEARSAEKIISQEIDNIEPQFDGESGECTGFNSWSSSTVKMASFKIKQIDGPTIGQEIPAEVRGEL